MHCSPMPECLQPEALLASCIAVLKCLSRFNRELVSRKEKEEKKRKGKERKGKERKGKERKGKEKKGKTRLRLSASIT